jgi:hypothetical protein
VAGTSVPGARIEWVGGVSPLVDDPEPCDFGTEASRRLEPVRFEGSQILVPPLDLQRAVNERRGLAHRVAMIDALQADDTLDGSVWRQPRHKPLV